MAIPTVPANYSGANWDAARQSQAQQIQALVPNVPYALFAGFGAKGGAASNLAIVQAIQAGKVGFSCTDVFGAANSLTWAQNWFIGNQNTGSDGVPVWSPGGTDFRGSTLSMPTAEGYDYSHYIASGASSYTLAQVQAILNNAYNVLRGTHVLMCMDDDRYASSWTGNNSYGATGLSGAIASVAIPALNQEIPTSIMYGVPITSINTAQTVALISWAALPLYGIGGVGPNMKVQVYANGVARGTAQSGTSYQDNSYTPGTIYTLGMVNDNGAGPQGSPLIGINAQWWASNSVWNTKIPAGTFATPMTNSAAVIAAYQGAGPNITDAAFRMNIDTYTTAFDTAPPGQATIKWDFSYNGNWNFPAIPATGAVATAMQAQQAYFSTPSGNPKDTDRHTALFSTNQQVFYSIYPDNQAAGNGPIPCVTGAPFPLTGSGWWNNNEFSTVSAGYAAGGSNAAGVIRPSEWTAGVIPHALCGAYPSSLCGNNSSSPDYPQFSQIYPARSTDAGGTNNGYLPEGARLQLDPSLTDAQLQALGVSVAMLPVCHALQTYGWYCIDIAGPYPTQIKTVSNVGGANQYPGVADLPLALMGHVRWIPGPYLTGGGALGPGVTITGSAA